MMSGVSSELGVSGTKMERHTPDNRPSSEEERGRAKNMANMVIRRGGKKVDHHWSTFP